MRRWSLPNLLSLTRLLGVPLLLPLAGLQPLGWFVAWYVVLGFTDWLDGFLARRWNQVTPLGSMLDSVADIAFYGATAYFAYRLFPEYVRPNLPWLYACFAMLGTLIAVTKLRLGRVVLPHTHLSRAAGVLAVAAFLGSFLMDGTGLLRLTIALYTISFVEMVAMAFTSRDLQQDTRSLLALRRAVSSPAP